MVMRNILKTLKYLCLTPLLRFNSRNCAKRLKKCIDLIVNNFVWKIFQHWSSLFTSNELIQT